MDSSPQSYQQLDQGHGQKNLSTTSKTRCESSARESRSSTHAGNVVRSVALVVGACLVLGVFALQGPTTSGRSSKVDDLAATPALRHGHMSSTACPDACLTQPSPSLTCRACYNRLSVKDFCDECISAGLNDIGCNACPRPTTSVQQVMTGADRDEHGCIPSAGYIWCESMASCIRPWEHGFTSEEEIAKTCTPKAHALELRADAGTMQQSVLVGADRDNHGCIPSAGYSWCESMSSCIRPWEHGISSEEEFAKQCTPKAHALELRADAGTMQQSVLVGADRDEHGCIPSAGYSWCEATSSCIRSWEHGVRNEEDFAKMCTPQSRTVAVGGDADKHGCRPSAGFQWCKSLSSCIRSWEHGIRSDQAFAAQCGHGPSEALAVRDADQQMLSSGTRQCNCPPSFAIWSCTAEDEAAIKNGTTCAFYRSPPLETPASIARPGGDGDKHGCHASAGYQWCESLSACIRSWEHNLKTQAAFDAECAPTAAHFRVGADADAHGCRKSAGYHWCDALSSCIKPWEHGISTPDGFTSKCSSPLLAPLKFWCNCPPSEAFMECTNDQFSKIMNGTDCEFYKRH